MADRYSRLADAMKSKGSGPLTTKRRNALPNSQFALPGRRYPLDTPDRARNALARGSEYATPAQQAQIKAAVRKRYPGINVS